MSKKKKPYLPDVRSYYDPSPAELKSYSANGKDYITLPNPTKDDIVCNNIASWELDYTDSLFEEETD